MAKKKSKRNLKLKVKKIGTVLKSIKSLPKVAVKKRKTLKTKSNQKTSLSNLNSKLNKKFNRKTKRLKSQSSKKSKSTKKKSSSKKYVFTVPGNTLSLTAADLKQPKTNQKTSQKKLKHRLLAAIDIGSNAIRIVVADHHLYQIRVLKKFRFAIRLGADVFTSGKISEKNMKLSARTFKKFSELAVQNHIHEIRAVGTSALREAKNSKAFVDLIYNKSGIKIEIIDGVAEARLIYQAIQREIQLENHKALLIDVGGGSVELTFANQGMMTATQSFPFGTVRLLEKMRKLHLSEQELAPFIKTQMEPISHFCSSGESLQFAIGTGGNIETLGKLKPKLLKLNSPTWLTTAELEVIMTKLQSMNRKQRVTRLGLRPDRADVIIPAGLLVLAILKDARLDKMLIPHVGLKDGLLCSLAQKQKFFDKAGV